MSDHATIVRTAKQSAETSKLMGVDFVPVSSKTKAATKANTASKANAAAQVEAKPAAKPKKPRRSRKSVQSAMDDLRARYEREAPHEKFVTDHTKIVWGDGDVMSRLMFVGEAPGAEEDAQGIPFVGRSGQLLNKMIEAIGLSRESVYIANVMKTRPPNNATPTVEEIELCAPYLLEQIAIIDPAAIVTLGKPAAQALLQTSEAMGRLRGSWHAVEVPIGELKTKSIPVMPTYHPAYVLRNYTQETRGKVWSDLKMAADRIES